jgi:hypothetical protein
MPYTLSHLARRGALAIALIVPLLLTAGCEQSKLKKVAAAVDGFSATVRAFQEAEIVAHQQGLVDDLEHKKIERALADVAHAGLELDNIVRVSEPKTWGQTSKSQVLAALNQAYATLDNLFTNGALHIKNPKARQDLEALLVSAKGFLATVSALLQ